MLHRLRALIAFAFALLCFNAAAAAPIGYLQGAPLGRTVPPPPAAGSELARMDLAMVRAAQTTPASHAWQEADGDARAYNADVVIRRFEDAWGDSLSADSRPILVYMLRRVIADTSAYAGAAKAANHRDRPYVGHSDIVPCNTAYLKDNESYPSGHAMNGYVVGSLLADLKPARDQALLARGVRYGENRVVCGVHHPIDVQEGRLLGVAYLDAVRASPAFLADMACVKEEDAHIAIPATPISKACAALVAPTTVPLSGSLSIGPKVARPIQDKSLQGLF